MLGMLAFPPLSILFDFVHKENLHLHNTEIFYTEFYSAESERVAFPDETEKCIFGSISFGTTSLPVRLCNEADSI
jgi:predicted nucleic-acid-binding Zn-ribbon protein